MDCWQCLQIEPTNNVKAIKRAYAKLIKQYSPESDPTAFQAIRQAFEQAKKQAAYIVEESESRSIDSSQEQQSAPDSSKSTQVEFEASETSIAEITMTSLSDSPNISSSLPNETNSNILTEQGLEKIDEEATLDHQETESSSALNELESAMTSFQAEFWQRFQTLLNSTEIKLEQWQSLVNSDLLYNLEIKQLLHYQVFESLVQVISETEKNTKLALNQQVIRLLTDTFGWKDNELALANAYGYDGVSLVMDFDSPIGTNRQRVIDEINQEESFFKSKIYPTLIWLILLGVLYFAFMIMDSKRESQTTISNSTNSSTYQSNTKTKVSQAYIIENCRRLFDIKAMPMETEALFSSCQSFAEELQDEYAALYIGSAKFLSSTLPLDLNLALSWLTKSADQGNDQATFWLGVLLEESGQRLQHDEDSNTVLQTAHYMGSRFARLYLHSSHLSKLVNEKNLDEFHIAVDTNQSELGHIAIIAHIYYRFILTHRQSSIPQYDLNEQSVREILQDFEPIISDGTALEKARLLHLILAYTQPYEYDAELKQIAGSFVSDMHNYQSIETYIWVAAFKAYTMDFGGANAIIDMAQIKLQQSQAYFAADYKQYLVDTMLKQQTAYAKMETVHIPLGDANIRQLAREMVIRTKQLAIKQLVEG